MGGTPTGTELCVWQKEQKGQKEPVDPTTLLEPAPKQEPELDQDQPAPESPSEVRFISRTQLRIRFNTRNYLNDGDPKAPILQCFKPKPNSAINQNFTPVFLAHARLYCFAHLRLIA